jgi:hypothetical protein
MRRDEETPFIDFVKELRQARQVWLEAIGKGGQVWTMWLRSSGQKNGDAPFPKKKVMTSPLCSVTLVPFRPRCYKQRISIPAYVFASSF